MPLFDPHPKEPVPAFPGTADVTDGRSAVAAVERLVSEAGRSVLGETERAAVRLGRAAGLAATGTRASAVVEGRPDTDLAAALIASAARRLPFVVHHLALPEQVPDRAPFRLCARTVQEAADFALIARRVAEETLTPALVDQHALLTAAAVQPVRLPGSDLIEAYLGGAGDTVACPTPAQTLLFGETRRRLPAWFDLDRPLGLGAAHDPADAFGMRAARQVFFDDHVLASTGQAMTEFAAHTGRRYAPVTGYRLDDAERVVVALGAPAEDLALVVDFVRKHRGLKAGALHVTLRRPLPADRVAELLAGARAVTVLETLPAGSFGDPPLLHDLRAALEPRHTARPEARRRWRASPASSDNRPVLYSGLFSDARLTFADLCAVFDHMQPAAARTRRFFLGLDFARSTARLPGLERLQQLVHRSYPDLDTRTLTSTSGPAPDSLPRKNGDALPYHAFRISTADDTRSAARMTARALFRALDQPVRSVPDAGDVTIVHAADRLPPEIARTRLDALVLAEPARLEEHALIDALRIGGAVVIDPSPEPAEALWSRFSPALRRRMRALQPRVYVVPARAVAASIATDPIHARLLAVPALMGGFLGVYSGIDRDARGRVLDHYRSELAAEFAGNEALLAQVLEALEKGEAAATSLDLDALPADDAPVPEPEAPWTVRAVPHPEGDVFDLARFWEDVGYLHATGRADETLVDPALATGAMPARSSAFRSTAALYHQTPRLLAENCTACGLCSALCPASAMPATVQDTAALLDTALATAEAGGHDLFQLRRIATHLAGQAHRIAASDDLHRYRTLGPLLDDAFTRLTGRLTLTEEQTAALTAEFSAVRASVAEFPIVKTQTFFTAPERAQKGAGRLFTLAIDPDTCTACGLCTRACPEAALDMAPRDDASVHAGRRNLDVLRRLPDVSLAQIRTFLDEHDADSSLALLFNRGVYYSRLGGDSAGTGSGGAIALHLVLAAVEARMQPRVRALIEKITGLIEQVETAIRTRLTRPLEVNDFGAFGKRLSGLDADRISLEDLAHLVEEETGVQEVDAAALQRLGAALDDLTRQKTAYEQAAHGDGRARLGLAWGAASPPAYPYNPYPFPWLFHLPSDAPAVAEGLFEGVRRRMAETFKVVRRAELLVHDTYDPAEHDAFFARFGPDDLTAEERATCPPVLVVADRASEALARVVGGPLPIKVVLLNADHEEAGLRALMHRRTFVLQSSVGAPGHLLRGALEGLDFEGPALFNLYAPDPERHGIRPDRVFDDAARAVAARAFPIFTCDPRRGEDLVDRLHVTGNPEPDRDWVTASESSSPLTVADWAAREARFAAHFVFVPRRDWSPDMTPLIDVLALPPAERDGKTPYVEVPAGDGTRVRKRVSAEMVEETERRLASWRLLLELAGVRSRLAAHYADEARAEMDAELARREQALRADTDAELARLEQTHTERAHAQLTHQLLQLSGFGTPDAARRRLRDLLERADPPETA